MESDYATYRLADFDVAGATADFVGREVSVYPDDGNKGFKVSAWSNTNYLSHDVWRGRMELVRVRDGLQVFGLAGGRMLIGFLAPGDQVLQLECSKDLADWQPWKAAFPGDGNTHAELLNTGTEDCRFFRLHRWPKPGS